MKISVTAIPLGTPPKYPCLLQTAIHHPQSLLTHVNPAIKPSTTYSTHTRNLGRPNSCSLTIIACTQKPDRFSIPPVLDHKPQTILESAPPGSINWQQSPLAFEFTCDDSTALCRAEEVLRYWVPASPASWQSSSNFPAPSPPIPIQISATRLIHTASPATYQFHPSQPSTLALSPRDLPTLLRSIEADAALAVLNHPELFLTVHGALLAKGDDALLIVGPSQAGKSTTSCALWAAGWQLLADDVTILHPGELASPLLRRVSLRHPSRELLGESFWQRIIASTTCDETPEGYVFHPDEIEGFSRARTVRLKAIVFLKRRGAEDPGPARLCPIHQVHALMSLAPFTNAIIHQDLGQTMRRLGPLANSIPGYDLGRGPLPAMVETLETLLKETQP